MGLRLGALESSLVTSIAAPWRCREFFASTQPVRQKCEAPTRESAAAMEDPTAIGGYTAAPSRIVIALKGHAASHAPQPVQAPRPCKVEDLTHPRLSSDSACVRQAATHCPHPVQRARSISGTAMRFEQRSGR